MVQFSYIFRPARCSALVHNLDELMLLLEQYLLPLVDKLFNLLVRCLLPYSLNWVAMLMPLMVEDSQMVKVR
jgi:hypothetical protein